MFSRVFYSLIQTVSKYRPLPDYDRLHRFLKVVPLRPDDFGKFSGLIWATDRPGGTKAKTNAGYLRKVRPNRADWYIGVDGFEFAASRLIYFMSTHINPGDLQVDHIDRNAYNNNITNLRLDYTGNLQCHNRSFSKPNTSGLIGVYWNKQKNKWVAQLQNKRKNNYLGAFSCKVEAASAYNDAVYMVIAKDCNKPVNILSDILCDCFRCSKSFIIEKSSLRNSSDGP